MTAKELTPVLVAGLISGGLFLIVFGIGLGVLFMFLPTLPLFSLGLSRPPQLALAAAFAAGFVIAVATVPAAAVMFILCLGLPVWYICRESLRQRTHAGEHQWFPLGLIMLQLTVCACAFVAMVSLYYDLTVPGGMAALLAQNIRDTFSDMQDEYGPFIDTLANGWTFLVFSVTIWLWGLALYAHGWVVHRALARKGTARRGDFSVQPFTMPGWVLSLLAICALASLIGSPPVSFLGKTTLISLMLPYFFLGVAIMHTASRTWPSRRFFLFFIYFIVFSLLWPALILAAVGLWHQIKGLSVRETSSRS